MGDWRHRAAAERLRQGPSDQFVWFEHDGRAYVTRDRATVQAVRDAYAPVKATGDAMGRIGAKMGAQGGRQGEVGARQGELAARQAALAGQLARAVESQTAHLTAEATAIERAWSDGVVTAEERAELEAARSRMRELTAQWRTDQQEARHALEAQMRQLAEQQRALGEQMRELSRPMAEHGAEMRALGEQMKAAIAAADGRVTAALGAAIASGKATPVK